MGDLRFATSKELSQLLCPHLFVIFKDSGEWSEVMSSTPSSAPPPGPTSAPQPPPPIAAANNGAVPPPMNIPPKVISEPPKEIPPPVSQPLPASKPAMASQMKPMAPVATESNNAKLLSQMDPPPPPGPPKEANGDSIKSSLAPLMTDTQKNSNPRPRVGPPPPTTSRVAPVIPHMPVKKPLVPEPVAKSVVEPSPLLPKSETTSKPNEGLLTALPKPASDILKPIIDEVKPISLKDFRPTKPVRLETEINAQPAKVEPNKPVMMAEPMTSPSSSSWGKEMDQMVKLDTKSGNSKTEQTAIVKPPPEESKPLIKPETKKQSEVPPVEKIVKPSVVESKAVEPLTKTEQPAIPSKVTAATPLSPPKTLSGLPVSQPLKATARPTLTPPSPSKSPVKPEQELKNSETKVQETEKKQQENGKKTEPKLASLPALETKSPPKKPTLTAEKTPRKSPAPKTPKEPLEPVRESKRSRTQVAHFESPIPELSQIMKDLKKKEKEEKANSEKPQENPPVFFKGEHLAVRNPEGSFYLCQTCQNIYRHSKKIKIQWLGLAPENNPGKNIF